MSTISLLFVLTLREPLAPFSERFAGIVQVTNQSEIQTIKVPLGHCGQM
jgi:hypothetical protein